MILSRRRMVKQFTQLLRQGIEMPLVGGLHQHYLRQTGPEKHYGGRQLCEWLDAHADAMEGHDLHLLLGGHFHSPE